MKMKKFVGKSAVLLIPSSVSNTVTICELKPHKCPIFRSILGIPVTIDDYTDFLEAQYHL